LLDSRERNAWTTRKECEKKSDILRGIWKEVNPWDSFLLPNFVCIDLTTPVRHGEVYAKEKTS